MSLTGWGLPTTLGIVAFVLFVLALSGRPQFTSTWANVVRRGVVVVLLNIAVLLLVGLYLNSQNGFYANWGDLLGADTPPGVTTQHGGSPAQAGDVQLPGAPDLTAVSAAVALPTLPTPHARLQRYVVKGARSGFNAPVWVRLPKGYNPASGRRYPVILAIHGYPGHPRAFQSLGGFMKDADTAESSGRMAPAIIVMPEANHPATRDTECVDIPHGPQAETWLASDVPTWVAQHFRVATDRRSWATWGYSFGGWCALSLSMRHPERFGAAVVFQGYTKPRFEESYVPFSPRSATAAAYDLEALARRQAPPVAVWMYSSAQDSLSYGPTSRLAAAARAPMSVTTVIARRGGHRVAVWLPLIPQTFGWLGDNVPGFRGSAAR